MEATSSVQQKDKRADGTPRRLCLSHCLFNRVDYCGKGTGHFWLSGKQLWKTIWNKCMELLVLYPCPNDSLNTVFDDVVSLFGSCSYNALAILPLRVRSLFLRERNMLYQIEIYPLGWLEGLLMQYSTDIKLKLKYLNTKIGLIAFYTRRTTMSFGISR